MATAPDYNQYLQEAIGVYDPIYKGKEGEINTSYDTGLKNFDESIRNEFNRRGILDSGLYGQEYATGKKDLESKKMSLISDLGLQRQKSIEALASSRYGNALDLYKTQLEDEREREAAAASARARAYSYSSGGGSTTKSSYGNPNAVPQSTHAAFRRVRDNSGGYQFYQYNTPITPMQYAQANGISLAQALEGSTNGGDRDIMNLISRGEYAEIRKRYPWLGV